MHPYFRLHLSSVLGFHVPSEGASRNVSEIMTAGLFCYSPSDLTTATGCCHHKRHFVTVKLDRVISFVSNHWESLPSDDLRCWRELLRFCSLISPSSSPSHPTPSPKFDLFVENTSVTLFRSNVERVVQRISFDPFEIFGATSGWDFLIHCLGSNVCKFCQILFQLLICSTDLGHTFVLSDTHNSRKKPTEDRK